MWFNKYKYDLRPMAKELVKRGWYISFSGVITFKNASKILEAVKAVPLDRIMIETDAPYLAPVPHRGKRNDSRELRYVVEKIAEIKGVSPELVEEMKKVLTAFGLKIKE